MELQQTALQMTEKQPFLTTDIFTFISGAEQTEHSTTIIFLITSKKKLQENQFTVNVHILRWHLKMLQEQLEKEEKKILITITSLL